MAAPFGNVEYGRLASSDSDEYVSPSSSESASRAPRKEKLPLVERAFLAFTALLVVLLLVLSSTMGRLRN